MKDKPVSERYICSLGVQASELASRSGLDWITYLQVQHLQQLPFSSANVLLGHELPLANEPLLDRILIKRRGGYCFEHNKIFFNVLYEHGYDVRALLARVLNNKTTEAPKSHRFTLLTLNAERYAVDVGFGGPCPIQPIKFSKQYTKCSDGSQYRVIAHPSAKDDYVLQMKKAGDEYTLYSFNLAQYIEPDFEMGHFYSYKHPEARFVNNLVVTRIVDGERRSICNNLYQRIRVDTVEETRIESAEQLHRLLENDMAYKLSTEECAVLFGNYCATN